MRNFNEPFIFSFDPEFSNVFPPGLKPSFPVRIPAPTTSPIDPAEFPPVAGPQDLVPTVPPMQRPAPVEPLEAIAITKPPVLYPEIPFVPTTSPVGPADSSPVFSPTDLIPSTPPAERPAPVEPPTDERVKPINLDPFLPPPTTSPIKPADIPPVVGPTDLEPSIPLLPIIEPPIIEPVEPPDREKAREKAEPLKPIDSEPWMPPPTTSPVKPPDIEVVKPIQLPAPPPEAKKPPAKPPVVREPALPPVATPVAKPPMDSPIEIALPVPEPIIVSPPVLKIDPSLPPAGTNPEPPSDEGVAPGSPASGPVLTPVEDGPPGGQPPEIEEPIERIKTRVQWEDSAGNYHAVRGARVKAFINRGPIYIEVGSGRTDEQGYLDVIARRPVFDIDELSFKVFADGPNHHVESLFLDLVYTFEVINKSVSSDGSVENIYIPYDSSGPYILAKLTERSFSVNDAAFVADKFYNNFLLGIVKSPAPSSSLPTITLFNGGNNDYFPAIATFDYERGSIAIGDYYAYDWDVFFHEYGHYLMWQNGWRIIDDPDENFHQRGVSNIVGREDKPLARSKESGLRISWSEGGAEYIGLAIQAVAKEGGYLPDIPNVGDDLMRIGDKIYDIENGNAFRAEGEGDELSVSRILWDLADSNSDTFRSGLRDNVSLGHKALFKAFEEIPGLDNLDNLWDAVSATAKYEMKADIGAIFEEYNVAPSPELAGGRLTVFESGTSPDLTWNPGNEVIRDGVTVEANDLFQGIIFNSDFSQIVSTSNPTRSLGWQPENWDSLEEGEIYNFVVVGTDDQKGFGGGEAYTGSNITGGYWSGARQFAIGSASGTIDTRALKTSTQLLASVRSGLQTANSLASLPLLGNLESNQSLTFLDSIQTGLTSELLSLNDLETSARIKQAFIDGLVKGGIDALSDDIDVVEESDGSTRFDFSLDGDFSLSSQSLAANLGLSGLGFDLSASGNLNLDVGYDFDFSLDIGENGQVEFKTPEEEDLKLRLKAVVPDGQLSGKLGFLQVTADTDSAKSSSVDLHLGIDIDNSTIKNVNMGGEANINLDLTTSFVGSETLPSLMADFDMDWSLDQRDTPRVAFNDVRVDVGSFFNSFASPILEKVGDFTAPIQPFVDFLNKDINLQVARFKMRDIANIAIEDPKDRKALNSLLDSLAFVDKVTDLAREPRSSGSNLAINLGSFDLGSTDVMSTSLDPARINPNILETPDFAQQIANASRAERRFFDELETSGGGLAFPILSDRTQAFNLLLGKDADLFTYDMPEVGFRAEYESPPIPIIWPLSAVFGGFVDIEADISMGFDTYGMRQVADGADMDSVFNGFYFDSDSNIGFEAGLTAAAELNAFIVRGGVGGEIAGELDIMLRDLNRDGDASKVHLNDIDPTNPFRYSGKVTAGLYGYIRSLFVTKRFRGPRLTVANFNSLNDSSGRTAGLQGDSPIPTEGTTIVVPGLGGEADAYERVGSAADDRIVGGSQSDFLLGGAGADELNGGDGFDVASYWDSAEGITLDLSTNYGSGDANGDTFSSIEQIEGSLFADILRGDSNNNVFDGLDGNDMLYGEGGDDAFAGSKGSDTIDGGQGNDTISYVGSDSPVAVDLQQGTAYGYGGNRDRIISIENLEGSAYGDRLKGDGNDNMLLGLDGDDVLIGGAGYDTMTGGGGRDRFFITGGGSDTITDFEVGRDLLRVDVDFFEDLRFVQSSSDTLIQLEGSQQLLATLQGVSAASIDKSSFDNEFSPKPVFQDPIVVFLPPPIPHL